MSARNTKDDPVWEALQNAQPRKVPLTEEQQQMLAEGREDARAGRSVDVYGKRAARS